MSRKMTYEEFIKKAKSRHGEKFTYDNDTENTFNGTRSRIVVTCPIHGKFEVIAKNHLLYDCNKCSYEKRALLMRSNTSEFIEKARKVHGNKYDYSKTEYITAKKDKVIVVCPEHGEFMILPNDHLSGKGCPRCNDSHLERDVSNALDESGVRYERGKHFKWLGKMELDFFIPESNTGIECQGKQHFGLGGWSDRYDFRKSYELDRKKNALCGENGVRLLYLVGKENSDVAERLGIYGKDNTFFNINDIIREL